ncbi:endoplasmic reticulum export factor secretory 16 isoform X3 [Rhynchophorus ferrugineus]|uniref:endoplasmic reticulum export factor secretory 16 isoform X3 n=1 Tax=Rhynchophorus ferrugineus TaxID=354439 RepID=UPI003FCD0ED9
MSWAQRRSSQRPNPVNNPPTQMYNPNQHSNTENQWQQQPMFKQEPTQQNYWQTPQSYPAPSHTPNANSSVQYQQQFQHDQSGYYQNYDQQAYGNLQYNQPFDQSGTYMNQAQHTNDADGWENWTWSEEDNSNVHGIVSQQQQQEQAGVNDLADSFANDESWNWGVSDSRQSDSNAQLQQPEQRMNDLFPKVGDIKKAPVQTAKTEQSRANRSKLETPQWSTESQPSLESSDDIAHTSESDKSHLVSRSSTISHSPISGNEHLATGGSEIANAEAQVENVEIIKQDVKVNSGLPPPKNILTPPLLPPPQGAADDSKNNPYKRNMGLSHKSANKFRSNAPLVSFTSQSVNLETLPDNSEHPDHPPAVEVVKVPTRGPPTHWTQTENNEVPINDRNQYLETGQLSDVGITDGNEGNDVGNDTLPPPGLQRMVPGQLEQHEANRRTDEPLLGLSRMVVGENNIGQAQYDMTGPPEGLRRMIPGESSSPETSLHQQNIDDNDSESELNHTVSSNVTNAPPQRSATIGADTPPRVPNPVIPVQPPSNRSEVIGGGDEESPNSGNDVPEPSVPKNVSLNDTKSKSLSKSKEKIEHHENRREKVEGQNNDTTVSSITNSIRNLTVGENLTDGQASNTSVHDHSPRRPSRQESSESDSDRKHPSRSRRDKRSMEKSKYRDKEKDRYRDRDGERERHKERDSDRYSPEAYRDRRDRREREKRYRDRRYEEDTDYYSDKEKDRRGRSEREPDYDRKYSSLRKEKDRRRKERDSRDYRDSRRYYGRYADDYGPENRSSRPSSRSDSMHDSYRDRRHDVDVRDRRPRDRDRERDRYRNREHRDGFNPYQGFSYDPYNPYYQQYQYYENLRRTNPQAYAEWYRKYYQQTVGSTVSFTADDRGSVHSGRSSANDELAKDRYTRQSFYSQSSLANYYGQSQSLSGQYGLDSSSFNRTYDQTDLSLTYEEQSTVAQRLTPAKFSTVHLKASIASGRMVRVLPHYPMDGQSATVEIRNFDYLLDNDPDYLELKSFPGPLVKGVTHKKQVIEYCDKKIKGAHYNRDIADVDSYVLMWELLILLIRQNGMVVGTDIAELLLKNQSTEAPPRSSSVLSNTSSNAAVEKNDNSDYPPQHGSSESGSTHSVMKEDEVTRKFREYLLYGSCKEALEWAMKRGLWGHALFLASKLDKRTYANVMMRFANGLTLNDPLQSLYQLLSGKIPAAVTCVSDEKWGDWRPHLAMILSNSTLRPDLNCRAITQLGDTLLGRGSLYAAQFCYLMAEVGFGQHGNSNTRLVLLGSDHRKSYPQFITNEAIHMTEIYEFACSLNDQGFHINEFQVYKYIMATRLADFGLLDKALQYLERLASHIVAQPVSTHLSLIERVCSLADKLKFHDPLGDPDEDEPGFGDDLETSRPDNLWLKDLKAIQNDYQAGKFIQDQYNEAYIQQDLNQQHSYNESNEAWQVHQQQQQSVYQYEHVQKPWQPEQPPEEPGQSHDDTLTNQYIDQQQNQNYWPGQPEQSNHYTQELLPEQQQFEQPHSYNENLNNLIEDVVPPQPKISMPNQSKRTSSYDVEPSAHSENQQDTSPMTKPQSPVRAPDVSKQQSTGWFGGIFSKLSMKPKNQMKLPDDKNPKIVWDQDKKRWVNVDEDPNDPANDFKPPPKMSDMKSQPAPGTGFGSLQSSSFVYGSSSANTSLTANVGSFYSDQRPTSLPSASASPAMVGSQGDDEATPKPVQSNMFKMQRGRNLKNAYVNVFKQNGTTTATPSGPGPLSGLEQSPPGPPQMNFFIPQPVNDPNAPVDFLTPGGAPVQVGEPQKKKSNSS